MSSISPAVSLSSWLNRFAAASYSRANGTDRLMANFSLTSSVRNLWEAPGRDRSAATKTLVSMTIWNLRTLVSYAIPAMLSTAQRALQAIWDGYHLIAGSYVFTTL